MPTGLKQTSSVVPIGFSIQESAANTFTQSQVDLNLSPLDREVFVVLSVNLNVTRPDGQAGLDSGSSAAVTSTRQLAANGVPTLADANCIARLDHSVTAAGFADAGIGFTNASAETPVGALEYIGIIATNDFFVQVQGFQNTGLKTATGKLYGYRAQASADIFAALVQSEVLSA
jgi:hypothetical protein